jgi:hypothetical protein
MPSQLPRRLPIDLRELEFAFEWNGPEARYFLNAQTGALVFITDDDDAHLSEYGPDDPDHPSRLSLDLLQSRDSVYLQVPSVSSRQGYEFMRDFIATVENIRLRIALENAIAERKPFRRFRSVLDRHPDDLQRWYGYKSARVMALVIDWLRGQGIEPMDAPPQA